MAAPWPPIDPPDPDPTPSPGALPGLGTFLRKRYTSNVAVVEEMSANDLLHEVLFPASRMFFSQSSNGKLALKSKKPSPYAFGTAAFTLGASTCSVDNVQSWIGTSNKIVLISPHTNQSEIRTLTNAVYTTAQNSVTLATTGGLFSTTNFSGCDGASTPATGQIRVTSATASTVCTVTFNISGEVIVFTFKTASSGDTKTTIASYIAGVIASHPALYRRFTVALSHSDEYVDITARFGTLTLNTALGYGVNAPLADSTTAPTLTAAGSGTLAAGDYCVAYSYVAANGQETLLSPYKRVTLTANQKINVTAITPLPAGASSVKWYCSPEANSIKLRYIANNNGTAFSINALPNLSAPLPPDLNRTGGEVMEVAAVFSDRANTRGNITGANVLKASFSWLLGNRNKTINRVDLKFRDSAQDWRLVELRIRDDAHIAKTKKISKLAVNGQAIDNVDQAYRITAGLLAENLDADFFYQWTATREALLHQEGDVVAIIDGGSGVVNLPVRIEDIGVDVSGGLPKVNFTARKYASTLYDDSIVERTIPVVPE